MSFESSGRCLYVQGGGGSWGQQTKKTITIPCASDHHQSIVAYVFQINTSVATFQRLVNILGSPKDTLQFRHKLHGTRQKIGELIKETSAELKQAIESDQHSQSSATRKIANGKLAKDFQSVVKKFQKAQQLAAQREAAYTPFISQETNPCRSQELQISSSARPESSSVILLECKRQELVHLEHEILLNEAIIEEREQGIMEIQQQIGEVNEMFKDMALLVHDQGIMLDDISSNIQSSHDATARAAQQLTKASKIQPCNSSMSCLLVVIFGVILLIIIVLVVA
ncbi:syntaxin-22-like [Nicotiana tomentosiformis]|uniref:syntaxin-22-like n=1 Tax=Nicotiana tomentosiformis TaxID=4098 RepID=UPI00051B2A5F|nr:syntaxin-22-like [Nicotiana tomentosiformis]